MLAYISHADCALHKAQEYVPEKPERIEVIERAIRALPNQPSISYHQAPLAHRDDLIRVHDTGYIDYILSLSPKPDELICLDTETCLNSHTKNAALRASGSVILAVDLLMSDQANAAFCNVRPPGHHAEQQRAMGFCFFNNIAVGVAYALNRYRLQRVAIVDFDVHHANGTEDIFRQNEAVLLCSSFEHPFYPATPFATNSKHLLNLPLPAGTGSHAYRKAVSEHWFEQLEAFEPDLICISAGFDAHKHDFMADFNLDKADYAWITKEVRRIANKTCNGRVISVLEGGYNLSVLGPSAAAHVAELL
jgi:acetoin utilization deacetylase AcuC-like enzyme